MAPAKDTDVLKDFYGYAHVLDSSFKDAVAAGTVKVEKGSVAQVTADGVITSEGTVIPADIIVTGTGYRRSYDWLSSSTRDRMAPEADGLWLYRNMVHPAVPGMAFVGSEVATISNIATHGIQAEWLARMFTGKLTLPAPESMKSAVEAHKAWARSWMPDTSSRSSLVLLHQVHYHDALLQDMGEAHRRKGANVLAEIFMPYQPRDYAGLSKLVRH